MSTTTTFDNAFAYELSTESWSLYAIGMIAICLRTYARLRLVGTKGLQIDDYLIWVAGALYTILIVCLNVIADGGGSNLYPPGTESAFTPEDIKERIKGSKIVIVSEQAMLNVIYTLKACLLIFYARLTSGLAHQRAVKILGVCVCLGWTATELAFFLSCRPFNGYWAVPPPNPQCTTLENYAITQGCFNITTDIAMLTICLPLVYTMTVPLKQKLVLLIVFGMGVFVIVAAILTKVFNLTNPYSSSYMLWYVRESSVAMYVANMPMIWPLLREWFPCLRSFGSRASGRVYNGQIVGATSKNGTITGGQLSRKSRRGTAFATTTEDKDKIIAFSAWDMEALRRDSDGDEIYEMQENGASGRDFDLGEGEIRKTTTFAVIEDEAAVMKWDHGEHSSRV